MMAGFPYPIQFTKNNAAIYYLILTNKDPKLCGLTTWKCTQFVKEKYTTFIKSANVFIVMLTTLIEEALSSKVGYKKLIT